MTTEDFLIQLQEVLQTDSVLTTDTVLADLDEWDSLAQMATMSFLNRNFGIKTNIAELAALGTVADLAHKAGL